LMSCDASTLHGGNGFGKPQAAATALASANGEENFSVAGHPSAPVEPGVAKSRQIAWGGTSMAGALSSASGAVIEPLWTRKPPLFTPASPRVTSKLRDRN